MRLGYLIGLAILLSALWLAFSGLYKPRMLFFGLSSIIICLVLVSRLRLLDREAAPYFRLPVYLSYWVWLMIEILKANWIVIRACLRAELDIQPALVKVATTCRTDLAKTVFANSITLTPGTVTLEVEGDWMLVHGLYEDQTQPEDFIEMDRRSAEAADGRKRETEVAG